MFKIVIKRKLSDSKLGIIGDLTLYENGRVILKCNTCENYEIGLQMEQDLAIPFGNYKIATHNSPRFFWHYKGVKNSQMPLIYNSIVPKSRCILIHSGNSHKDTAGCILVGEYKSVCFTNSRITLNRLLSLIYDNNSGAFSECELSIENSILS